MKISKIFQITCFVILVSCSLTKDRYLGVEGEVHKLIFTQYGQDFSVFQNEIQTLNSIVVAKKQADWVSTVRAQLLRTRNAYKKIEFIFDYLEPNYAYLYINGGPLPKLHKEVSEVDIIPPNGLQRLDELVFSEELMTNYQEISDKTKELQQAINFIKDSHLSDTLSQQNVFESLRSGVVRIFTLGLTGFDTPGSANGILESLVSMRAMRNAFSMYRSSLTNKEQVHFEEIIEVFNQGIQYLEENKDFDTFDRMTFLKQVVNPLYKDLYSFQQLVQVEDRPLNRHSQDYSSTHLFSENFLDLGYYSQFAFNDIKNEASIKLGKLLFYDPILSHNLDLSCSTCHNPKLGFSDGLIKSATNLQNVTTKRNSPTLLDVGFSSKYFWDMREHDLEKQVAHVVEDSLEFNLGFKEIEKRLKQSSEYVGLFEEAYGGIASNTINRRSISNAIASYVNTLNSFDSSFDKYVRGEISELKASAIAGFNLFMGKAACGTCHFAPVFNGSVPPFYKDAESEVLGVPQKYTSLHPILDRDQGRSGNGRSGDAHPHFDNSFKTVTVRNTQLTAPYMHNGGFETLEEVLDFYNVGGGLGMGLDVDHQTLAGDSLHLNELEVGQLISFLHALTDTTGLQPGKIELPKFEGQPYWNKRGEPIIID